MENVICCIEEIKTQDYNQYFFTKFCLRQQILNHYSSEEKFRTCFMRTSPECFSSGIQDIGVPSAGELAFCNDFISSVSDISSLKRTRNE